jgi:hypothetical protein
VTKGGLALSRLITLILLDLNKPRMSGEEFRAAYRKRRRCHQEPDKTRSAQATLSGTVGSIGVKPVRTT